MNYDPFFEILAEFSISVQNLVNLGWKLDVHYGEQRLDIGTAIIAKKDDQEVRLYSINDLQQLLSADKASFPGHFPIP